jgi:ribonuclease P protein component
LRTEGLRVRHGALRASFLADEGPSTRVGYAITKQVGTAVVRNRLRRRLRAIVAAVGRDRPELLPHGVLVVGAGPDANLRGAEELRYDVERLLEVLSTRCEASR